MENQVQLCDYGCGKPALYRFKNKKFCCSSRCSMCFNIRKKSSKPKPIYTKSVFFNNKNKVLCDYGCGQIAKFQFKNKKVCCSKHIKVCTNKRNLGIKKKKKQLVWKRIGKEPDFVRENIEVFLCDYGCGKEAKYQFKNGKWCCSTSFLSCESVKNNSKRILLIKQNHKGMKGKHHSKETKNKIRIDHAGKTWEEIFGNEKAKILKYRQQQLMLNGLALKMNKAIKNPSKPQVELFNRVLELYPTSILNYPLIELNYSLDIAIPDLKIWIESDGTYWHQDKEKDLERQRKIESFGWKCIRYVADDIKQVPSRKKIELDIENLKN